MSGYGVTKETREGGSARMQGGINENASLTEALFGSPRTDGTGDSVIIVNFQGPTGTFKHIEWPVNPVKVKEYSVTKWEKAESDGVVLSKRDKSIYSGVDEFVDAEIARAFENFNSRLKHIAKAFETNEDLIIFDGNSYEAIGNQFVKFLNERKTRNKVDLLLTLDSKGENLGFPLFPKFIQKAGTTPTTLIVTKYIRTGVTSTPDAEASKSGAAAFGKEELEPEF